MSSPTYENVPGRSYEGLATSAAEKTSGWVGWGIFASVMMIISGTLNAFYGLVAAVNDDWVVWTNRSAVYLDLTTWGWVHMVLGVIVIIAGFGVLTGNVLARTVGVFMAAISLMANFFFIPVYPFWSISVMVLDALVIWALTVHGSELRQPR